MESQYQLARRRNFIWEIWTYRYALHNLIMKDFRVRYRNMSLGVAWSILNPLIMLGVLVIVFTYIQPQHINEPFTIFLLLGMIPFNFFSLCITPATTCVIDNAALVKKVIFPRKILPISVVLSQGIHFLIQVLLLVILVAIYVGFYHSLHPSALWLWLPVIYLVELVFIFGVSLAVSAISVYFRDALYLVVSGTMVLFWFTPIFYRLDMVKASLEKINPALYWVYLLNPLAGVVDASRKVLMENRPPDMESFGMTLGVSGAALVIGLLLFSAREKNFADKI